MHNLTLRITPKFIIAFILLRHIFHEAHEFAHMISARIFTGVWGTRDFNNVQPFAANTEPTKTQQVITGLAGPMINYIFCFIGAAMITRAATLKQKAWGLILIFACLPFARIFTAFTGGGDELGVVKNFAIGSAARIIDIVCVTALFAYPLYIAFKTLPRRYRWITCISFLLLPMFFEGLVVLGLMNKMLNAGILISPVYFGAPLLVIVELGVVCITYIFFAKYTTAFLRKETPMI